MGKFFQLLPGRKKHKNGYHILNSNLHIKTCSLTDFQWIYQHLELFWGDRRTEHIHHPIFVREFGNTAFVVKENDSIIAYLLAFFSQTEPIGYIHAIGIHLQYQQKGIGRELYRTFMDLCLAHNCQKIKAIITLQNKKSIAFHRAMGFDLVGSDEIEETPVVLHYAGRDRHRVVMVKDLLLAVDLT